MNHPPRRARRTARMLLAAVTVAGLALGVTACGEDSSSGDATSSTTAGSGEDLPDDDDDDEDDMTDPLAGTTFSSTGLTGRDLVPGSTVRLTFTDGTIGLLAGCNLMGGGYSLDGDRLVLDESMHSTEMGCSEPLMDQDTWLANWIQGDVTWQLDGDTLTLTGGDVTMELAAERDDGTATVEGTWELDTIVSGETASSVPAEVPTPTLEVTGDQANVFTGCNRGGTTVTVEDDTITFGALRLTRMACEASAMDLEATVTAVLDGNVSYSIEFDRLTLGDDTAGLVWRRVA